MQHQPAYRLFDEGHFLNWGFLFPDDPSLCQVDNNNNWHSHEDKRLPPLHALTMMLPVLKRQAIGYKPWTETRYSPPCNLSVSGILPQQQKTITSAKHFITDHTNQMTFQYKILLRVVMFLLTL